MIGGDPEKLADYLKAPMRLLPKRRIPFSLSAFLAGMILVLLGIAVFGGTAQSAPPLRASAPAAQPAAQPLALAPLPAQPPQAAAAPPAPVSAQQLPPPPPQQPPPIPPQPAAASTGSSGLGLSVARFLDPSTHCRSNSALAPWDAGAFAAAAQSVVAYRTSIVELTHELTWGEHLGPNKETSHKPYKSLPAVQPLAGCQRYGSGDGGKYVCSAGALQPGCVIYSLGSNGNFEFEQAMLAATPCEIFTFDCTVEAARVPALPPRIHFHALCVGDSEEASSQYRSLFSLMQQFGHSQVDVLKVDVEGWEFRLVEGVFRAVVQRSSSGAAPPLPMQILMEQHYLSNEQMRWGRGNNPGLSSGEMAILWMNLVEMGYALVHREDQPECPYCTELVAARAFC